MGSQSVTGARIYTMLHFLNISQPHSIILLPVRKLRYVNLTLSLPPTSHPPPLIALTANHPFLFDAHHTTASPLPAASGCKPWPDYHPQPHEADPFRTDSSEKPADHAAPDVLWATRPTLAAATGEGGGERAGRAPARGSRSAAAGTPPRRTPAASDAVREVARRQIRQRPASPGPRAIRCASSSSVATAPRSRTPPPTSGPSAHRLELHRLELPGGVPLPGVYLGLAGVTVWAARYTTSSRIRSGRRMSIIRCGCWGKEAGRRRKGRRGVVEGEGDSDAVEGCCGLSAGDGEGAVRMGRGLSLL
jgi:hypothetical protein